MLCSSTACCSIIVIGNHELKPNEPHDIKVTRSCYVRVWFTIDDDDTEFSMPTETFRRLFNVPAH